MTPSTSISAKPALKLSTDLNELSLETLVQQVLSSGQITATERQGFYRFLLADLPLTSTTIEQIRQVFDRVRAGLIRVVD
ncbi:MAG: hypothetical protein ACKO7W_20705 [Elainella sp.]